MARGDTLLNAAIGALVSIVLAFLPLSPAIGGAVAAYLQRGGRREGARVGAISGVLASLPLVVLFGLLATVVAAVTPADPSGVSVLFLFFLLVAFAFVVAYGVGLGAVGGYLAAYLFEEEVL